MPLLMPGVLLYLTLLLRSATEAMDLLEEGRWFPVPHVGTRLQGAPMRRAGTGAGSVYSAA
jgi:hypothetical protein